MTTPGFEIGDTLDGLVKATRLLQEELIGFGQASALCSGSMGLTPGDVATGAQHLQMFHTADVGKAHVYLVSSNQLVIICHAITSLKEPMHSKAGWLR